MFESGERGSDFTFFCQPGALFRLEESGACPQLQSPDLSMQRFPNFTISYKDSLFASQFLLCSDCRAFSVAICNIFPSVIVEDQYKMVPMIEQLCSCGSGKIETIEHTLLHCDYYKEF